MPHSSKTKTETTPAPSLAEAVRFWFKLGWISFGGPAAQIAILHAELVEKRRWISEGRFLHALNFCMLLPGPEAQQLATYIGWLLHRTVGGVLAGSLFVLPSAAILWALSWTYAAHGQLPAVAALFDGLKPAVLAIVLMALYRTGGRALKSAPLWVIAAGAFIALFFFHAPFPILIAAAGISGFLIERVARRSPNAGPKESVRLAPTTASARTGTPPAATPSTAAIDDTSGVPDHARPSWRRAVTVIGAVGVLWWLPVMGLGAWLGTNHVLFQQGLFFSKAAMVTFGGAYAVLPYVSQQAVENYQWLDAPQMLDGLGLAETTPGPLIMVLQFVGFLGGWKFPEPFTPLAAATLGAFVTTWTTFLPCFLWIFLGAPYVEQLRQYRALNSALAAITAAVVGVILNLAIWFGLHVLAPAGRPVNGFGICVCLVALAGMGRWRWGAIPVIAGAGALGVIRYWIGARI